MPNNLFSWRPQPPDRPDAEPGEIIDVVSESIELSSTPLNLRSVNLPMPPGDAPRQSAYAVNVGLVGPQFSGKSAYIAALAAWNRQAQRETACPVFTVNPFGDATRALADNFENIFLQGKSFQRTALQDPGNLVPLTYSVTATFKQEFDRNLENGLTLEINLQDFAGEFFSKFPELVQTNRTLVDSYIADYVSKDGLMFVVDGTARYRDREYRASLDQFIDQWFIATGNLCRMAIVVGKAEDSDLWSGRYNPQRIIEQRFPQLTQAIDAWRTQGGKLQVSYFASSAFGTKGTTNHRQPNSKTVKKDGDGILATIAQPKFWRPFGLISPLYWLATQQRPPRMPGEVEPW